LILKHLRLRTLAVKEKISLLRQPLENKKPRNRQESGFFVDFDVASTGIEPVTQGFSVLCSTI
jgi:hypothetical protein